MDGASAGIPAPGVYVGEVMHHRLRPFRHRFVYRVFTLLLDLDRLDEMLRATRLFGSRKPCPLTFRLHDHGPRDGSPLRPWVERELCKAGMVWRPETIRLLTFPRLFGYVFNPLSIYYCYGADGRLGAIVYEVRNTFGEQHAYALAAPDDRRAGATVRQQCDKGFYVSPFIAMDARYRFRLSEPGAQLRIVIQQENDAGTQLSACMNLRRQELTDRALLANLVRTPLMTLKVIAAIHFEAFRLWCKGAEIHPRKKNVGGSSCTLVSEAPTIR